MKKLGFIFIALLVSQGALADKVAANYSNIAAAIAETGATLGWAPQYADNYVSEHQIKVIDIKAQAVSDKMALKLEQRITDMIESDLNK